MMAYEYTPKHTHTDAKYAQNKYSKCFKIVRLIYVFFTIQYFIALTFVCVCVK